MTTFLRFIAAVTVALLSTTTGCRPDAAPAAVPPGDVVSKGETLRVAKATPSAVPAERMPRFLRPDLAPPPTAPMRIVSMAPVVTEIVFEMGAQARLVGVTTYCDRPAAAKTLPKIGGFTSASFEKILERKPDLVIAMPSMGQRQILDRLVENNVPVLVAFGDTIDEIAASMDAIGTAVASRQSARTKAQAFATSLTKLAKAPTVGPLNVIVTVSADPVVVAGNDTFPNAALVIAGATPVVGKSGPDWPIWSLEALAESSADVVVAAEGPTGAAKLREALTRMGSKKKVVSADAAILMRPGPHLAADIQTLARLLAQDRPASTTP